MTEVRADVGVNTKGTGTGVARAWYEVRLQYRIGSAQLVFPVRKIL